MPSAAAVPRVATYTSTFPRPVASFPPTSASVKRAKFEHVWRASGAEAPGLLCSMLEPYTFLIHQPQAATQIARAGQREPLLISFYTGYGFIYR